MGFEFWFIRCSLSCVFWCSVVCLEERFFFFFFIEGLVGFGGVGGVYRVEIGVRF